jgi:hypothetical protein
MATIQSYVNTGSTSGGDGTTNNTVGATRAYSTLAEWAINLSGGSTDDYIVDCCGTVADTFAVEVAAVISITSGSILIRGNRSDPAGFYEGTEVISSSHYRLSGTLTTNAHMLSLSDVNITVDGIQIEASRSSSTGASAFRLVFLTSSGGVTVKNCRVLGLNSGANIGGGIGNSSSSGNSGTAVFENNLVVSCGIGIDRRVPTHFSPTITVYHNTVWGIGGTAGILINRSSSGTGTPTVTVRGNAVGNNTDDISNLGTRGSYSAVDNATEDATGQVTGIVPADAWTSHGLTAASVFTLKNSSSDLYQVVDPNLLSEDIIEFNRGGAPNDAGCFELSSPTGTEALAGQFSTGSAGTASPVNSVAL